MARVILNAGSNMGDRLGHIRKAIAAIAAEFGEISVSDYIESEPQGFDSLNSFINVGIAFESELHPMEILQRTRNIERALSKVAHRNPDGSYADREIDIDIVAVGSVAVASRLLTLPHPRLEERIFFLRPLAQLHPEWRHPVSGLSAVEMLESLNSTGNEN